jgi:hypothetical protein
MTLSLTKDIDGMYIDQDGLSWDTRAEWLWMGLMGGCGCGQADEFGERAVKLLKHFATPHMERDHSIYDNDFYELMAHWFDSLELIEHGGIVTGSWLTEKGDQVYALVRVGDGPKEDDDG